MGYMADQLRLPVPERIDETCPCSTCEPMALADDPVDAEVQEAESVLYYGLRVGTLNDTVRLRVVAGGRLELDMHDVPRRDLLRVMYDTVPVLYRARCIRPGRWYPEDLTVLSPFDELSLWWKVRMLLDGCGPDEQEWEHILFDVVAAVPRPHRKRLRALRGFLRRAAHQNGRPAAEEAWHHIADAIQRGIHGVGGQYPIRPILREWPDPRRPPTDDAVVRYLGRIASRLLYAELRGEKRRREKEVPLPEPFDLRDDRRVDARLEEEALLRQLAPRLTGQLRRALEGIVRYDARDPADLVRLLSISPQNAQALFHRLRRELEPVRNKLAAPL